MSSRVVLDTNAYSALFRGDQDVLEVLAAAERAYLPVTVIGELHAGFRGGSQNQRNRRQLSHFLNRPTVKILHTTTEVADYYAEILHALRRKKAPIPTNDIWIAAHTMEQGAVLMTFDRHFQNVDGLRLWR